MEKIILMNEKDVKVARTDNTIVTIPLTSIQYTGAKVGDIVELFKDGDNYIVIKKESPQNSTSGNSKEDKKKRKGKTTILLEKEGAESIKVECPKSIKLNLIQAYMELRFGIPPMNVTPVDKIGLLVIVVLFVSIFILGWLVSAFVEVGLNGVALFISLLVIADFIFNGIVTAGYYRYYIQKKIREGYEVKDSEAQELLRMAGINLQ